MKLEEKIVLCRKKAGLSQEELAEKLAVSRQAVSRWETGAALPNLEKLIELSRLFSISLDYLLLEERTEPEARPADPKTEPRCSVKERRRKFRICLGASCGILGLLTAIAALIGTQLTAERLTEWVTSLGRFGTALRSWWGGLLLLGIALFLAGMGILVCEYRRND